MTKSIGLGDGAQGARHRESEFLSTLIGEGVDPSEERFGRHQGAVRVQASTEGTHGGGGPAYWTGLMREVISMQSEGQIRDVFRGLSEAHAIELTVSRLSELQRRSSVGLILASLSETIASTCFTSAAAGVHPPTPRPPMSTERKVSYLTRDAIRGNQR